MKAFLSYSLNDSEQYVLSILVKRLNEQGFIVSSSYDNYSFVDFGNYSRINGSNLFIGVITQSSEEYQRVISEWETAVKRHVPALLLVENTVTVHPPYSSNTNIIRFDRYNPESSIEAVKQKISQSKTVALDSSTAWALGGLAVVALIALLSTSKK